MDRELQKLKEKYARRQAEEDALDKAIVLSGLASDTLMTSTGLDMFDTFTTNANHSVSHRAQDGMAKVDVLHSQYIRALGGLHVLSQTQVQCIECREMIRNFCDLSHQFPNDSTLEKNRHQARKIFRLNSKPSLVRRLSVETRNRLCSPIPALGRSQKGYQRVGHQ